MIMGWGLCRGNKMNLSATSIGNVKNVLKRMLFMYVSKLEIVFLKFYDENSERILEHLPIVRVIEQYDNECTIEAGTFGKGVLCGS